MIQGGQHLGVALEADPAGAVGGDGLRQDFERDSRAEVAAATGVSYQVHPGIPGDDAEATPGAGSGFDPDHPPGARLRPLACTSAYPKGLATAADWVWDPTSAGGW